MSAIIHGRGHTILSLKLFIVFRNIVFSKLSYWQQTLQTGIHVAVEGIVLQANDAIFRFGGAQTLEGLLPVARDNSIVGLRRRII